MAATDKRHIDKLRAGQHAACEQFVREQHRDLYRWLYRLTGCSDQAAELTQESFVGFLESLKRTTPQGSLRAWLYAIARNQWRKKCRGRDTRERQPDDRLDRIAAPQSSPHAVLEQQEFAENLQSALLDLSAEYREVFSLRVWHEFDYAEIAAVQGVGVGLVRWRFFRARQMIRDRLKVWNEVP